MVPDPSNSNGHGAHAASGPKRQDRAKRPVRVLIVDDSAVVRQILARELARDPEIDVIGTAGDPFIARDKILREKPDVLTLDIEMPRMDGITFLKKLMVYHPLPIIILSSLAQHGTNIALEALEWGAVAVFAKPKCDIRHSLTESMLELAEVIKGAAGAKLSAIRPPPAQHVSISQTKIEKPAKSSLIRTTDKVIVIGASTGGTEALKTVLSTLTGDSPGVLAVIHMPECFTRRFAERLNELCSIEVREAADGDCLHDGLALIARGDHHLLLSRSGTRYVAELCKGPPICRHRPSVEVLFQSAAQNAGPNALGIIMTGMGADGADGLLAMRQRGSHTIAQDEATCIVYGMPKEAVLRGAAAEVLPLDRIAGACMSWSKGSFTNG